MSTILVTIRFKLRPHSSLKNFSPFETHHDSHCASQVARFNDGDLENRQREARKIFSLQPRNQFRLGDKVLLRTKRHQFHRISPIFYPTFSNKCYTISSIDKKYLPWLYSLAEISDKRRRFYGFELKKFDDILPIEGAEFDSTIFVEDVIIKRDSKLRSGRILPGKEEVFYTILKDGRREEIPEQTLQLFHRSFGPDALRYSHQFQDADKSSYII